MRLSESFSWRAREELFGGAGQLLWHPWRWLQVAGLAAALLRRGELDGAAFERIVGNPCSISHKG